MVNPSSAGLISKEASTRILFVFFLILAYGFNFKSEYTLLENQLYGCFPLKIFDIFGLTCVDHKVFTLLYFSFVVFGFLIILGYKTKFFLILIFLEFLFYRGQILSQSHFYLNGTVYTPHNDNLIAILFLIMIIALKDPSGIVFRYPQHREQAEKDHLKFYFLLSISLTYFFAFLAKVQESGFAWADGQSLRFYFLESFLLFDRPLALVFAKSHLICMMLGWLTLLFEALFFLVLIFPRLQVPFLIVGLMFHTLAIYSLNANFFIGFLASYVILISSPSRGFLSSLARRQMKPSRI